METETNDEKDLFDWLTDGLLIDLYVEIDYRLSRGEVAPIDLEATQRLRSVLEREMWRRKMPVRSIKHILADPVPSY